MSAVRKPSSASTPEIRERLAALQASVRDMLATVPGVAGSRPVDIVASLGLDLKLAWKVARIAQSGDPFACVRHLPGATGWRIVLDAARKAGAATATITAADAAFERALADGVAWAGDRKAFEMMAADLARGSDLRIDVEHRRQLYLGGSYVWGVRARLALRADIIGPAPRGKHLDCATIRGFVDVERLRSDAPWLLEAPFVVDDRGTKPVPTRLVPLDPDADRAAAAPHILREFSTDPLPTLRPPAVKRPTRALELAEGGVGSEGRFTIFQGSLLRGIQPVRTSKRHHGIFQLSKHRTPVERSVFDLIVHESLVGSKAHPEAILYSDLNSTPSTFLHESTDRIPAGLAVDALGSGVRRAKLDGFARYGELLEHAFASLGWSPSEFHLFRVEAPYPPVPSTLSFELPLEEDA